jgi:LuxR family quorum-sensing transcriptional regulator LasR
MRMKPIDRFAELMCCGTLAQWRDKVFALGKELGYDQALLAILPDRSTPVESEFAFQLSNYSSAWLKKYDSEKMGYIDPAVTHVMSKTTPLIWSPEVFSQGRQREMYEEANSYGLCSGVSLPIHGANGELGIVCFVSDDSSSRFNQYIISSLPELSCFRDFIFESSGKFMKSAPSQVPPAHITTRELECLKWGAAGKSSWEIGQILHCSEATVNFHFSNIRRKLNSKSRQQAVVKAIRLGLIYPS